MSRNTFYNSKNNTPPHRVKIKGVPSRVSRHSASFSHSQRHWSLRLASTFLLFALFLLTTSCVYDSAYDGEQTDGMAVELSIVTRSITSDTYTYEVGAQWENYINISGGDYKIYFFTNDKNDATGSEKNTLIAEFVPTEMTAVDGSTYTQYTLSGEVGEDIATYSNFKVVVLANWGTYPSVTAGTTTIDDLVEGDNSTFLADAFLTTDGVSSSHLIPFYGVHEYSNVKWKKGWRTTLEENITLLRALAKVEVVLDVENSIISELDGVSIVRYNNSGYCAPAGVYLKSDYDHDYSWDDDFTSSVHLVGGKNSGVVGELRTHVFNHQGTTSASDVWTIYLPEYDNSSNADDYSYIRITAGGGEYQVYFSDYTDGTTSSSADYDIFRNYIYRFYVTYSSGGFMVVVEKWANAFDNEWSFGDMDPEGSGEPMEDGTRFYYDGLEYDVVSSADRTIEVTYINSSSITTYWGTIVIPETVTYDGVTYTVIGIAEGTFDNGAGITSVTIPATVTYIGGYAFENCSNMVSITCLNPEPPECEYYAFFGADTDVCILYVPDESVSIYAETVPWNAFENIKGVSEIQ